jgi:fumarate reductase subunit D
MATPRENSVKHLGDLYNVVIGIALSLAIVNMIDLPDKNIPFKTNYLYQFITFIIILIPFYHGSIRHLYATYVENGGIS